MKALVIGGAGFVGNYLITHLINDCKWYVDATKMVNQSIELQNIQQYNLDILDKSAVSDLLTSLKPDYIFHLAAQSSTAFSWEKPDIAADVNIKGSINILEAVRKLSYKPRILLIGSSEEYGRITADESPIAEDSYIRPCNIYAATKACQNMIGKIYHEAYHMDIIMVRAFNHAGPKQSPIFVISDFCNQVAKIENSLQEPIIKVGNLSVKRDFTDVRDVVKAYSLLTQKGLSGETYNVGSGKAVTLEDVLNIILSYSKEITIEVDPAKLRPVDVPIIEADIRKLQNCTGWERKIPLSKTILDTLNYWRAYYKK